MAEEAATEAEVWSWCGSTEQHKLLLQIISEPADAPTAAAALLGGRPLQVRHVLQLAALISNDKWVKGFKLSLPSSGSKDRGVWLHCWLHYLGCSGVQASFGAQSLFSRALLSWATREAKLAKDRLEAARLASLEGKQTGELRAASSEQIEQEENPGLEVFELPASLRVKLGCAEQHSPSPRQPIATPVAPSPPPASRDAADAAGTEPTPPAASEGEAALGGIDLLAAAAAAELPAAEVEQAVAQRLDDETPTEQRLRAELTTARKTSWAVHEVRRQG